MDGKARRSNVLAVVGSSLSVYRVLWEPKSHMLKSPAPWPSTPKMNSSKFPPSSNRFHAAVTRAALPALLDPALVPKPLSCIPLLLRRASLPSGRSKAGAAAAGAFPPCRGAAYIGLTDTVRMQYIYISIIRKHM